jgi:hypothetical protein
MRERMSEGKIARILGGWLGDYIGNEYSPDDKREGLSDQTIEEFQKGFISTDYGFRRAD